MSRHPYMISPNRLQNKNLRPGPKVRASDGRKPGTKPYKWNGETYWGAAAVAAAVPCPVSRVNAHMRKYKNLNKLTKAPGEKTRGNPSGKCTPVSLDIGGVKFEWPSIRQMAIAIGWTTSAAQRCYASKGRGRKKLEAAILAAGKGE